MFTLIRLVCPVRLIISSDIEPRLEAMRLDRCAQRDPAPRRGRDFAAWLGLVPKQISTGDRVILGGITKRGNRDLRTLFVQGARSVLFRPNSWAKHRFSRWLTAAAHRLHKNVLAI